MLKQVARSWSVVVYVALRAGAIIEHAVEPEEEYWPDAHVAQELEEADDEYLPAEHEVQDEASVAEYFPLEHEYEVLEPRKKQPKLRC